MQSLRFDGKELLWQGDSRYWSGRAPNLFPYIARLTNGSYTHGGKLYRMGIHGFVKGSELVVSEGVKELTFTLLSSPETLEQYPFPFRYEVSYRISDTCVSILYRVENTGGGPMYFGVGGHPGFRVPIEENLSFDDYYVEFSQPCEPRRILFSPEKFVCGTEPFPLDEGRYLPLRHSLFDDDAIILEGTSGAAMLKSKKGHLEIAVESPDFAYLGFWHTPESDAPFLCVEPWSSLPSRQGVVEELSRQENLIKLESGEVYCNEWRIAIHG